MRPNFNYPNPKTHGEARPATPEYRAWSAMRQRCGNPTDARFPRYGGRGITVCARWENSYEDFLADVGRRPSDAHSLDRIDNEAGYSPENCRWATMAEQARNKRTSQIIEYAGEKLCVVDWAIRTGISASTIMRRLGAGWSAERALAEPSGMRSGSNTAADAPMWLDSYGVTPHGPLTEADVALIRSACSHGDRVTDIAPLFGVSTTTISQIKTGRTWAHVGGPTCPRTRIGPLGQKRRAA